MKLTKADLHNRLICYAEGMFFHQRRTLIKKNWHQERICRALERCVMGRTRRLIISVSPRSGKTLFVSQSFVAWAMGAHPHAHFILTSYSHRLAAANTYAVRAMMQSELHRELYPASRLMDDSRARDEFRTTAGGVVYGVGTGGAITGYGAGQVDAGFGGAIIIDDPTKPDDADSDLMRQNVIDWYQQTLESRRNHPDTPIIIIAQRLHENDLPGWLLAGGSGEEWEHLKIPALDDDDQSFWPEQFPAEDLIRQRESNPYVFAAQRQQEPAPKGGGDFRPGNIQIVDALPAKLKYVRGWDLAATTKKTSDYTASVKLGIDADGVVWIAHAHRFRGSPDEVERSIVQHAQTDTDTRQSIPRDPGQAGVSQEVALSRKLHGTRFDFSPESGDKRGRASPLAAQVNVGNVRMLKGDWNQDLLSEMMSFPRGTHDDQVDAASRAYNAQIARTSTLTTSRLF